MSLEYPCVYHKDGKCEKFAEPGYISWCVYGPCSHQVQSNGDRIRTMSDEELARMLHEQSDSYCKNLPECGYLLDTPNGIPAEKCIGCALEWLELPAKEGAEKDADG